MTAVLVGTFEIGSPEWHAARANGLGGSEIGAVLGLSPFESRFSLWHRKAGMIEPVEQTPAMEWGTRLEQPILKKYAEVHADDLTEWAVHPGTYCTDDRPWQIANPDAVAADRIVDAKFSMFGDGWGEDGSDEVPPHIRTQGVWYCDVLDRPFFDIACLIGGYDYREYRIQFDSVEADLLRRRGAAFLDDLARRARPDIDSHTETYETIKELHPDIAPDTVMLDNDTAREFISAKAAAKVADERARLATSVVADRMGDAQKAEWDGTVVARRQVRGDSRPFVVIGRNLPDLTDETSAA